jgi:hypothetical protein
MYITLIFLETWNLVNVFLRPAPLNAYFVQDEDLAQSCFHIHNTSPELDTRVVFGNRVLRIFGPKRDEVRGGWRKLHNEELHSLYSKYN